MIEQSLFENRGIDLSLPAASDWADTVEPFLTSGLGRQIIASLEKAEQEKVKVYPPEVFRALKLTPLAQTRVVILGQDPYHGEGQAEGLAFSVPLKKTPPSLRNIKKEIARDLGISMSEANSLVPWARQGVLLLNSVLTVEDGKPASHSRWGWQTLTDALIARVSATQPHCVFMLWGNYAQGKRSLIDEGRHLVLEANHPSPLSALRPPVPFIGCGHFGKANAWLESVGLAQVNWQL